MIEAAYRPGSEADFDRLYRDTYQRVVRTLAALLGDRAAAEDCAQEAYVKAYRAWDRWRPEAPAEAWIHQIAIRQAVSYRRRARLREAGELVRRLGRPPATADPTVIAESRVLRDALRHLDHRLASALVLRHYHGYTNRELAAALSVSERTVGARLAEAKRRLRDLLGAEFEAADLPSSREPRVLPHVTGSAGDA
jgi:RNA polymerase sigma-70 factor (ECF subfamily)